MVSRLVCLLSVWVFIPMNLSQGADSIRYVGPHADAGMSSAVVVHNRALAQTTQFAAHLEQGQEAILGKDQIARQVSQLLQQIDDALKLAGSDLTQAVKLNVYVADENAVPAVQKSLAEKFNGPAKPAVTYVVSRLPGADGHVAMDAIGAIPDGKADAVRTIAGRANQPPAAQAQLPRVSILPTGQRIYISGQAENAASLAEATRLTLLSLEKSLAVCGRGKSDVTHVKCFLLPMARVGEVNRELEQFFAPGPVPPVAHVEWKSTLPIEIEVVAYGGSLKAEASTSPIEFLTPPGLMASPVFSRMARTSHRDVIFVSGLYGKTGADGGQQVQQIFSELGGLLTETGSSFRHLAKATYYVSEEEPSQKLNELRPKYYDPKSPPAASKAQVRGVGKTGTGLAIDMIAVPSE